jgi:putative ABC transport system permease protein
MVPVRVVSGHHERIAAITGTEPDARLRRIVTANRGIQPLPPEGMVLSEFLAKKLDVSTGDTVRVELLEGDRRKVDVRVVGVVEDFLGVAIYMDLEALHRLAGGGRSISGAYLAVLPSARAELGARLKRVPAIAGVASPALMMASFQKQLADGLFIAVFFILAFSSVISVAVIYNGARVSLSERGRELASLRVLGFSRREVAVLLLGEQAITTVFALPLGWGLGYAMAAAVSASIQTELFRIPFVISLSTFAYATGATLVSAVLSAWIVRRRLDRMDLIEVLKTRE